MDYVTKPVSRNDLRRFAKYFREIFKIDDSKPVPVLDLLEQLPDKFDGCHFIVIEDDKMPKKRVACCKQEEDGGFLIEIKKYIYDGAKRGIAAYCGFILHEIVHIFMYKIGYTPILERTFDSFTPVYCSVEWQVKALTGEIAMPYEKTRNMTIEEIMYNYNVSRGFAESRKKY